MLSTSATLSRSAASLTPGTHRLSFEVQDQEGEWSAPSNASLYVATAPQAQWTMLLYLAGDYHDCGSQLSAFTQTLEELKRSFRNPYVRIAVQVDGPADGDTRRLLFVPGTAYSEFPTFSYERVVEHHFTTPSGGYYISGSCF